MKSLFEQLVDEIDAAIVDVTLTKLPKGEKAKKLRMLITARDYQLHVASIMDKIYPSRICVVSNGWAECKTIGCVNIPKCEAAVMKRLRIEGRIIPAIDELPDAEPEPSQCSGGCGIEGVKLVSIPCRKGMNTPPRKIDPHKTWQI